MVPTSTFRVADDSFMTRQLDNSKEEEGKKCNPSNAAVSTLCTMQFYGTRASFDMHDILLPAAFYCRDFGLINSSATKPVAVTN